MEIVVAAVAAAMMAMVAGGFLLAYFAGRVLFPRHIGRAAGLGLLGAGAGSLLLVATFFPDVWSPPPRLRIEIPASFAHPDAILIEDARAEAELAWRGSQIPFFGLSATVSIPAKGILRVRSFGPLAGRGDTDIEWSDGARTVGMASGPGPSGAHATAYLIYMREHAHQFGAIESDATRERYILQREQGR